MARLIDELLVRDWRLPAGATALPPAEARTLRARIRVALALRAAVAMWTGSRTPAE